MNNFLYIRGLRHAAHTVFCVQEGQKFYYDPQFGMRCAYSSGQQVKRSVIDSVLQAMGAKPAPITFNYTINKKDAIENKEPWSPCDPSYPDQLLGGWMKAQTDEGVLKRRSPLSFSAMRPLHPLLGGIESQKENLTFDRSSNPNLHPVIVKDSEGKVLSDEEIIDYLQKNKRTLTRRNWIPENTRATGLFVYDVAIDLRTLFSVSTNLHEPELSKEKMQQLQDAGWTKGSNDFGECLNAPKSTVEKIIPALAEGLVSWRITSNQSRTFSLMETLGIAVSENANKIPLAIRAELSEEKERTAIPVISKSSGANTFISVTANGYIPGAGGTETALDDAIEHIKNILTMNYK